MTRSGRDAWDEVPPGRGGCPTGKFRYSNRKQAKKLGRRIATHRTVRAYPCPECDGFHLGHKPQRVRNGTVDKDDWLNGREPR